MIPSEVTTALKAVTAAFGGTEAAQAAPAVPMSAVAAPAGQPDRTASAVPQAPVSQAPATREMGPPEAQAAIAWQQSQPEAGAQQTEQAVPHPELALDADSAVGAGITQVSPRGGNGNGPASGEDR